MSFFLFKISNTGFEDLDILFSVDVHGYGITAAFGSSADIADFLGNMRISNPQAVADDLLAGALERTGGIAPDDMTVLAVRLLRAEDAAA